MQSFLANGGIIGITRIYGEDSGIFTLKDITFVDPGLYPFETFTFTPGGQTGQTGPTLQTLLNSSDYDTTANPWLTDTNYFNMTTTGIQEWTVPRTTTYNITTYGAGGGEAYQGTGGGGLGAKMSGDFVLTEGDIIKILVGQAGLDNFDTSRRGASGGGGTFVYNTTTSTLLIASGGGGGGGQYAKVGNSDANITTNGNAGLRGTFGAGGTGGNGGGAGTYSGGGAGWLTNGTDSPYGKGGKRFSDATLPGYGGNLYSDGVVGAFGGAGGTYAGAGGAGGYSGGGAGGWSYSGEGGGGGSYNIGGNKSNEAGNNAGDGSVVITL